MDEVKTFQDFMPNSEEYPFSKFVPDEILPFGEEWNYVSISFINGFVNCGDLLGAVLLNRFHDYEENFKEEKVSLYPPGKFSEWQNFYYSSKKGLVEKLKEGWRTFHTKLDIFRDDVLLLKILENNEGHPSYLYIWCDCDLSDCSIGRFKTDLPKREVLKLFFEHAFYLSCKKGYKPPIYLDEDWFTGSLSF